MKLYLWLAAAVFLLFPLYSRAASNEFFIFDQNKEQIYRVDSDLKVVNIENTGPSPAALVPAPDNSGYFLMFQGSKSLFGGVNASGGLILLNREMKPAGRQFILPGMVVRHFYLKEPARWIFFTQDASNQAWLTIYDLTVQTDTRFNLSSVPTACRFNEDRSMLAITTLGSAGKKVPAQLRLIDLAAGKMQSFPVSANPGGIFFRDESEIVVACGGFRPAFKYSSATPVERFDKPVNACLHWIDISTGAEKITTIGYSPVVIIQDRNDPDTFFTASSDTIYENEPKGKFRKLTDGEITAETDFPAEPVQLIQSSTGNIALLGREEFFLLDSAGTSTLGNLKYQLKVDKLHLNEDGTLGYLSVVNSSYLDVVDMTTGALVSKIKIRPLGLGGALNISGLFATPLPPVAGGSLPGDDKPSFAAANFQMVLSGDYSRIYSLSNLQEVKTIDLKSGETLFSNKFYQGKPYGIHLTPNEKYIVVATDTTWYLLDPAQKKPVLKIPVFQGDFPASTGYYSPDGNLLVIPSNGYFYLVDCQKGRLISKFRAGVRKATVFWVE